MFVGADYPFLDVFWTMLVFFVWVIWIWLLITILIDVFRRHDIGGAKKVLWVIFLIILPYIGIFAYLLTQHRGMAERDQARAKQVREDLRNVVGFSVADEIEKLDKLKASGSISAEEHARLRAKLVQ